ncbi:hypothetical protein BYT27DRAFT_7216025 [Phlegmacium glaucopus]|nr:hypothetical protein BYT27DRAFT_7216025 [Phlegmacium glaucopus]
MSNTVGNTHHCTSEPHSRSYILGEDFYTTRNRPGRKDEFPWRRHVTPTSFRVQEIGMKSRTRWNGRKRILNAQLATGKMKVKAKKFVLVATATKTYTCYLTYCRGDFYGLLIGVRIKARILLWNGGVEMFLGISHASTPPHSFRSRVPLEGQKRHAGGEQINQYQIPMEVLVGDNDDDKSL